MSKKKYFSTVLFVIFSLIALAQTYNRVEATVSIKTKYENGKGTLEMGKIYFDKRNKKLIYDFTFPEKQTIAIFDTTIAVLKNGLLIDKQKIAPLLNSTLFNVILEGELLNYGLRSSNIYKIKKIEKDRDLVITTWEFKGKNKVFGNVLVSTKGKDLYGVVFLNSKGEVVSKQLFSQYVLINGLRFPTEITQVMYQDKKQVYQVTSFKNIIVNSLNNEKYYNFILPRK
jgi:hypothetical protein